MVFVTGVAVFTPFAVSEPVTATGVPAEPNSPPEIEHAVTCVQLYESFVVFGTTTFVGFAENVHDGSDEHVCVVQLVLHVAGHEPFALPLSHCSPASTVPL